MTDDLLNRRMCPLCGGGIVLTNSEFSTADRVNTLVEWTCMNCGTRFEAELNCVSGEVVIRERKVEIDKTQIKPDILGRI